MFTPKPIPKPTKLDEAIDSLLDEMKGFSGDDDEYAVMVNQLVKLYSLQPPPEVKQRLSPDTLALISANLVGILIIVAHERANVVTTKALTFVRKLV